LPQVHLVTWQGHNDIDRTVPEIRKSLDRAHQDGLAAQLQKLLGQFRAKSRATAASHYDSYRLHHITVSILAAKVVKNDKFKKKKILNTLKRNFKPRLKIPF
jgi:hypothetical protein